MSRRSASQHSTGPEMPRKYREYAPGGMKILQPRTDTSAIRSITALCDYLSTEGQGTEVSLQNVTITSRTTGEHGGANDPRSACWRSLAVKPQRAEISERNIGNGLFRLGNFNEKDIIHGVISGAGTRLKAGKLFLGARGCVVLDDTCEEVLLADVGITGGIVICYGRGCNITMKKLTFDRCSLVVLAGANVHLIDCKTVMADTNTEGICLFAHGRGTEVRINGGMLSHGIQGMSVQHGASINANGLSIKASGVTAAEVLHEGSKLTMLACHVDGPTTSSAGKCGTRGVFVHSKGMAALEETTIKSSTSKVSGVTASGPRSSSARSAKLYSGVNVTTQSTVALTKVSVSDTVGSCVLFDEACIGELEDCTLSNSQAGSGLEVSMRGTEVEATGCRFTTNAICGAYVSKGARLVLKHCQGGGNKACDFQCIDSKLSCTACKNE